MSFIASTTLDKTSLYNQLGISVSSGSDKVDVTYEAVSLSYFDGKTGIAQFKTSVGDTPGASLYPFKFDYSGTGNPLDVAESALKSHLTT